MLNPSTESSSEEAPRSAFVQKFELKIWAGMDQKNILNQAFSIIPDDQRILRIVSLLIHTGVFVWLALSIPSPMFPSIWNIAAQIGVWGLFVNTVYFGLTFLFQNAGPYDLSWKGVYILGEISAALAFLICPIFLIYLLPSLLTSDAKPSLLNISLYMVIHIICPILIWAEIFFTYYVFPRQHVKCLLPLVSCYGIINLLYTAIKGEPVYRVIDWISIHSYLFLGLSFVILICGYSLGNMQYRWKMRKESKSIVTTLQLNEVSSPSKLSQYAPISYDF